MNAAPGVREAASVGLPDPDQGERIAVALVMEPGAEPLTVAELGARMAAAGAAVFKRPERIFVLAALPRNAMNKVVRAELRELVLGQAN